MTYGKRRILFCNQLKLNGNESFSCFNFISWISIYRKSKLSLIKQDILPISNTFISLAFIFQPWYLLKRGLWECSGLLIWRKDPVLTMDQLQKSSNYHMPLWICSSSNEPQPRVGGRINYPEKQPRVRKNITRGMVLFTSRWPCSCPQTSDIFLAHCTPTGQAKLSSKLMRTLSCSKKYREVSEPAMGPATVFFWTIKGCLQNFSQKPLSQHGGFFWNFKEIQSKISSNLSHSTFLRGWVQGKLL